VAAERTRLRSIQIVTRVRRWPGLAYVT